MEGPDMNEACIRRATLISYYTECLSTVSRFDEFCQKVKEALRQDELLPAVKKMLSKFIHDYKTRMKNCTYNKQRFQNKNEDWIQAYLTFPVISTASAGKRNSGENAGRPSKNFTECSDRAKRRKTEELRKIYPPEQLVYAAQMEYRTERELSASKILKDISNQGPSAAKHYSTRHETKCQLSSDKALSLLLEAGLTKYQYNVIVSYAKEVNCHIYPPYETIISAKSECYPDNVTVTETCAKVPVQNLLDHTSKRLCLSLNETIKSLMPEQRRRLCLITKWGSDGSGCHSQYNQKFQEEGKDDNYMFITSMVPVQLYEEKESGEKDILWQNPRPSSTRYCRPIKLEFIQETTATSKAVTDEIMSQIEELQSTTIQIEGGEAIIKHHMNLTMIDGKMVNAITDTTSAQRCYLCKITIKDFNRIKYCLSAMINETFLQFGISPLHAWIRFAECILHIGYKLKIARYQARGIAAQKSVKDEKTRIQKDFFEKLGLHVDKPRPGGGTSTTGNIARKIFQNFDISAEITGVHKGLIYRLYVVLCLLSSGQDIDAKKFKTYCIKIAQIFTFTFPWYQMPTTLHKVLIHGYQVIENAETAIGLLSEDAQEARNKDVRAYRENYSRKFSRQLSLQDTYQRLMATSDPLITGLRKCPPKPKITNMPPECYELLKNKDT